MFQLIKPLITISSSTPSLADRQEASSSLVSPLKAPVGALSGIGKWGVFGVAAFLVSVPVFFQAPLVRLVPLLSLALTGVLVIMARSLARQPDTWLLGDLTYGFAWTWLAGSIYWGWFRWEPLLHLPLEAIALPFALIGMRRIQTPVGHWFYLGSLIGTALTDLYFYLVNLIPHWRQLMQVSPDQAPPIFQAALAQMQTPWGVGSALLVVTVLLVVGLLPLRSQQLHHWAFSGAILSTVMVDGLFLLLAIAA